MSFPSLFIVSSSTFHVSLEVSQIKVLFMFIKEKMIEHSFLAVIP